MKAEKIEYLAESYHNGNITEVKKAVKKMSKADFICLLAGINNKKGETVTFEILNLGLKLTS